ncbi:unnamed protein product, partial [Rotaria magnacalcarata]
MKDNLDKVLERDAKLTTLENRAEVLQTGASQFTTNASKLKRKYWWKNVKLLLLNRLKVTTTESSLAKT